MAATAPADDKVDPKVIKTGLILVVGFIAVVFDTTIVSVALHTLVDPAAHVRLDHPVGHHRLPARPRAWRCRCPPGRCGGSGASGCGCSRWPSSWSGRSARAWPGTSTR